MLLQTNSYVVPKDRRAEHARLLRRFRQTLARLGCEHFEAYEQVGQNWNTAETSGRFVQIMRFRDRRHQLAVQAAERQDAVAQQLIAEFCELINFPYQQQQGLFAVGFYNSALPVAPSRPGSGEISRAGEPMRDEQATGGPEDEIAAAEAVAAVATASEVPPADQQTYVAPAEPTAEFSEQPLEPDLAPQTQHVEVHREKAEAAAEDASEPNLETIGAAPASVEETPNAGDEETTAFRDEMEALGAVFDHQPMTTSADLAAPESDLVGLDVELPDEPAGGESHAADHANSAEHCANGNGAAVGGNGSPESHDSASRLDDADADLARDLHDSGPAGDSFESLLEEPSNGQGHHNGAEDHSGPAPSGSGIGDVLDSGLLDDDDLDIALPADLIDDELSPHAPEPHHGHGNERG